MVINSRKINLKSQARQIIFHKVWLNNGERERLVVFRCCNLILIHHFNNKRMQLLSIDCRHQAVKYLQFIQYPKIAYVCLNAHDLLSFYFLIHSLSLFSSYAGHRGLCLMKMPQSTSIRIISNWWKCMDLGWWCHLAWIGGIKTTSLKHNTRATTRLSEHK